MASTSMAQDDSKREDREKNKRIDHNQKTLFKDAKPVGAFVAMSFKPFEMADQAAMMAGGELSLVCGHKLNIGLAGYGMMSNVHSDFVDPDGNTYFYNMGYGGMKFEPVLRSDWLVHVTFPVFIGAGGVSLSQHHFLNDHHWSSNTWDSDFFLITEPGINLELNIFKIMRLDAGVSYRFANDVNLVGANNSALSGLSGNVSLKIGWF